MRRREYKLCLIKVKILHNFPHKICCFLIGHRSLLNMNYFTLRNVLGEKNCNLFQNNYSIEFTKKSNSKLLPFT